ncbi:MAG TPA: DUF3726 domain-containing protein [Xanthobacteraceae bacterium]
MTWSLNEIEAEAKKAVRGAGLPWGIAEEGAKAVRWLAANGVDALPALADLLDRHAAGEMSTAINTADAFHWRGATPLCPLLLGAAIADHAHLFAQGREISAAPVAHPLLLVPFVARAARAAKHALALTAAGAEVVVSELGSAQGPLTALDIATADGIKCAPAAAAGPGLDHRTCQVAAIDPHAWERIARYAFRTYVPASAQSRLQGAGAGAIDND